MKDVLPTPRPGFDGAATYRIVVQGRIPARWCDRLEGMTITEGPQEAEPPVSTLLGEVADQAALAGVLSTLYGLHLSVLEVRCLSAGYAGHL